ncbi:MAG: hypothetical protein LBT40_10985 [Deltaproteobacteria bacterium]|jgi:hypothetical protein|nr:hypothetical protein [Deltaproteobacteria bacterium]
MSIIIVVGNAGLYHNDKSIKKVDLTKHKNCPFNLNPPPSKDQLFHAKDEPNKDLQKADIPATDKSKSKTDDRDDG